MIYNFKTKGCSPVNFRDYQMFLELFENLKDGDVNANKVIKNK